MPRIRGLSNHDYAARKAAIVRAIQLASQGDAIDPLPPSQVADLDRRKVYG
jgi:hypothetical protein